MKNLVIVSVLAVMIACSGSAFAQVKVESSGGLATSVTPPTTLMLVGKDGRQVPVRVVTGVTDAVVYSGYGTGYGMAVSYSDLCTTPCKLTLDAGPHKFMFGDLNTTLWVDAAGQPVAYSLEPGNQGMQIGGWVLMSVGLPAAISGSVLLAFSDVLGRDVRDGGIAALTIGVGALVSGIVMYVLSRGKSEQVPVESVEPYF